MAAFLAGLDDGFLGSAGPHGGIAAWNEVRVALAAESPLERWGDADVVSHG